jgi:hypothetical protein
LVRPGGGFGFGRRRHPNRRINQLLAHVDGAV